MPQLLDPSMTLFRQNGGIVLRRRTWPESYPHFQVHPVCAVILALLDGQRSPKEVAEIVAAVFDFPADDAGRTTQLTMRKYERFLTDSDRLDGRQPVAYDPAEFLIHAPRSLRLFPRETVPQYIWWRVTRYCNRRCKYCCVAARHAQQAPDASISFERLRELFTEGADIGVRGVSLSGGEPFIRADMVDIIELLLGLHYEVEVDTKFGLSDEQIGRLAAAGLPEVHVSIDSPYAETANYLVGDDTYFSGVTRSIRSLIAHGIRVTTTAVLTQRNAKELPALTEFLIGLGVEQITLNSFSRYYGQCRYVEMFELSDETRAWLRETLPALREQCGTRLKILLDRNFNSADDGTCAGARDENPNALSLHCDQGIRVLRMLPDGRVSRCDQWWHEEDVVFGDLRHQSIYEVWSSSKLLDMLNPGRTLFHGSICEHCDVFDACSSTGRCMFAALEANGTPYGPDDHCVRRAAS